MFRETIQKTLDRLESPGGAAGILMGFDGITVDSYTRPGGVDVQTVCMELAHVIAQIRRTARSAQIGGLREMQVLTDRVAILIQLVSDDYFLVFGVEPDGNLGKARYLLRMLTPQIRAQL